MGEWGAVHWSLGKQGLDNSHWSLGKRWIGDRTLDIREIGGAVEWGADNSHWSLDIGEGMEWGSGISVIGICFGFVDDIGLRRIMALELRNGGLNSNKTKGLGEGAFASLR